MKFMVSWKFQAWYDFRNYIGLVIQCIKDGSVPKGYSGWKGQLEKRGTFIDTDTDGEMKIWNRDTEFEFKHISFPVKSIYFVFPKTVFRESLFLFLLRETLGHTIVKTATSWCRLLRRWKRGLVHRNEQAGCKFIRSEFATKYKDSDL